MRHLTWDVKTFLDQVQERLKTVIDEHANYYTAGLNRSRPVQKRTARRRRSYAQVAADIHTMGTSFVRKTNPYGTRRAVDGRHVEWKGGERHSRVPDTSERAQREWKGWQNPRRHLSDWQLADKFGMFRPPILTRLLVKSAAQARFWERRMVAKADTLSEVQAMCIVRLCGVVKELARTFTWCNEVEVSSAQYVEEGAERRMYHSSHWAAWFSPIWIWGILVD